MPFAKMCKWPFLMDVGESDSVATGDQSFAFLSYLLKPYHAFFLSTLGQPELGHCLFVLLAHQYPSQLRIRTK